MKKIYTILFLLTILNPGFAQDIRTTETRVADILALMPVNTITDLRQQMNEMMLIGTEGRKQIMDMVVPPGSGDDTRARFAIESYSRYLSEYGHDKERIQWESECIDAIHSSGYPGVRSFFLSQLKLIGTNRSVEFASGFLTDKDLCEEAVAVITSCESHDKEDILAMSLQIEALPCVASVLNALADIKSIKGRIEYISWYKKGNIAVKAAALNAMAECAHESVYETIAEAAADVNYGWDITGATSSLVQYARNAGEKGEINTLEKICRDIFNKGAVQYKIAALEALVHHKGYEALEYLLSGFKTGDMEYRKAILDLSLDIPGKAATKWWMSLLQDVDEQRKVEIIMMLGDRGDLSALPAIKDAMYCPSTPARSEAALALAKLQGREAVQELIDYIRSYETAEDQIAGYRALVTVADSRKRDLLEDAIEASGNITKGTILLVLSTGGENRFFDTMMEYTSSDDTRLRNIAFSELKNLADPDDQKELLELLLNISDETEIEHVRDAIAAAANEIQDREERSSVVIRKLQETEEYAKLLPVLADIGGEKALAMVSFLFSKGNAEMRAEAYNAITDWIDASAVDILFEICKSGNKNYSGRAFDDYVNMVSEAAIADNNKLELYERILPYALTEDQKNTLKQKISILNESLSTGDSENSLPDEAVYTLSEQEKEDGFIALFNGTDLDGWTGNKEAYRAEQGIITVSPVQGSGGNLYTVEEFSDFILRFEFQLTPGANNGLGIRAPLEGDAAYVGMELQILDNTADIYANLQPYQYHGSVYGVIPARKDFLKPVGEWNEQEVIVQGNKIKVVLNGTVILDGDITDAIENGTVDKRDHPGLKRKTGHIGFLGHGSVVKFRNIRIKELMDI